MLDYLQLFYGSVGALHPRISLFCAGGLGAAVFAAVWYAVAVQYWSEHPRTSLESARSAEVALSGEISGLRVVPDVADPMRSRVFVEFFVINRGPQTSLMRWQVDVKLVSRLLHISERALGDWTPTEAFRLHGSNFLNNDELIPQGGKRSGWLEFSLPTHGLVEGDPLTTSAIQGIVIYFTDVDANAFQIAWSGSRHD